MFKEFILCAKNSYQWMSSYQDLLQVLEIENAKNGLFQNKFNFKINVCLCFIFGANNHSYLMSKILDLYKQDNGNKLKLFIKSNFKKMLKKVIKDTFVNKDPKYRKHQDYIHNILYRLDPYSENNAIEKLSHYMFNKINFLFCVLNSEDKEAISNFSLRYTPSLKTYINSQFLEYHNTPLKAMILESKFTQFTEKELEQYILDIIYRSIECYLFFVLNIDHL